MKELVYAGLDWPLAQSHKAWIALAITSCIAGATPVPGLGQAVEIAPLRSSTSDILNLASVAAYSAGVIDYGKKN